MLLYKYEVNGVWWKFTLFLPLKECVHYWFFAPTPCPIKMLSRANDFQSLQRNALHRTWWPRRQAFQNLSNQTKLNRAYCLSCVNTISFFIIPICREAKRWSGWGNRDLAVKRRDSLRSKRGFVREIFVERWHSIFGLKEIVAGHPQRDIILFKNNRSICYLSKTFIMERDWDCSPFLKLCSHKTWSELRILTFKLQNLDIFLGFRHCFISDIDFTTIQKGWTFSFSLKFPKGHLQRQ